MKTHIRCENHEAGYRTLPCTCQKLAVDWCFLAGLEIAHKKCEKLEDKIEKVKIQLNKIRNEHYCDPYEIVKEALKEFDS